MPSAHYSNTNVEHLALHQQTDEGEPFTLQCISRCKEPLGQSRFQCLRTLHSQDCVNIVMGEFFVNEKSDSRFSRGTAWREQAFDERRESAGRSGQNRRREVRAAAIIGYGFAQSGLIKFCEKFLVWCCEESAPAAITKRHLLSVLVVCILALRIVLGFFVWWFFRCGERKKHLVWLFFTPVRSWQREEREEKSVPRSA